MGGVFVSHAASDRRLIDGFVKNILRLGCNLTPEQVFYSSRVATGVPIGANLNDYVRRSLSEAELVIAVVTPAFRDRPFCLAELGAAWREVGELMPLTLPGTRLSDLDGVLSGLMVRALDDNDGLDEIHDRVCKVAGTSTGARVWGEAKDGWLEFLQTYVTAREGVSAEAVSSASCARDSDHMELFWTDGSGRVYYRWWLDDAGWSDVWSWEEPPASHLAAASRGPGDQWLFGVLDRGRVWSRRWVANDDGWMVAGPVEWIPGDVSGPLTVVTKQSGHLELFAWTREQEQCHTYREDGRWTPWATTWWRA